MEHRDSSYSGGGWKRWIWIYLAVAAVAYLVIYLVFFRSSGGGGGGGGNGGGYLVLTFPATWLAARRRGRSG